MPPSEMRRSRLAAELDEAAQQLARGGERTLQAVEYLLAISARVYQPAVPQDSQVMGNGRLTKFQLGTQLGNVELAQPQRRQNPETILVAKNSKCSSQQPVIGSSSGHGTSFYHPEPKGITLVYFHTHFARPNAAQRDCTPNCQTC